MNALESNLKELKDQQSNLQTTAQNLSGELDSMKVSQILVKLYLCKLSSTMDLIFLYNKFKNLLSFLSNPRFLLSLKISPFEKSLNSVLLLFRTPQHHNEHLQPYFIP